MHTLVSIHDIDIIPNKLIKGILFLYYFMTESSLLQQYPLDEACAAEIHSLPHQLSVSWCVCVSPRRALALSRGRGVAAQSSDAQTQDAHPMSHGAYSVASQPAQSAMFKFGFDLPEEGEPSAPTSGPAAAPAFRAEGDGVVHHFLLRPPTGSSPTPDPPVTSLTEV